MPHTPHNPPQRLLQKVLSSEDVPSPIATYYAMCDWFDETCGQLLDRLDEKGVADNTLVIYVTDNGWIQDPNGGGYAGSLETKSLRRWDPNADHVSLARQG